MISNVHPTALAYFREVDGDGECLSEGDSILATAGALVTSVPQHRLESAPILRERPAVLTAAHCLLPTGRKLRLLRAFPKREP